MFKEAKERFQRWQMNRTMRRLSGEGERITDPEEAKRRAIEMAAGETDIKILVSPESNSPLFQALPDILRNADPDATAQIILAMPKDFVPTGDTRETLEQILEITERRNRPEIISDEDEDLNKLNLELHGTSGLDKLAVLVQDPKNPEQYWYRRIGIERGSIQTDSGREVPYVDIARYPMPGLDEAPCPATNINTGVANLVEIESWLSTHPKQELRDMHATVGVARYTGSNDLTVGKVLRLAAIKYSKMIQSQA